MMDDGVGTTTVQHLAGTVFVPVEGNGVPLFVGPVAYVRTAVYPPQHSIVNGRCVALYTAESCCIAGWKEFVLRGLSLFFLGTYPTSHTMSPAQNT